MAATASIDARRKDPMLLDTAQRQKPPLPPSIERDFSMRLESQSELRKVEVPPRSGRGRISAAALLSGLVALHLMLIACTSGLTISVKLMPEAAQTLEPGKVFPISATLLNDTTKQGVRWTLSGQGLLVAQTATSVMYQAPPNVSGEMSVTVTATSVADRSRSASLKIILVAAKQAGPVPQDEQDRGV